MQIHVAIDSCDDKLGDKFIAELRQEEQGVHEEKLLLSR